MRHARKSMESVKNLHSLDSPRIRRLEWPAARQVTVAAAASVQSAANAKTLLDRYCVNCHNVNDSVAGLKLDSINVNRLSENTETWEKIVRKLKSGMEPKVSTTGVTLEPA